MRRSSAASRRNPLILYRYLLRELSKPLAIILGTLVALFASYAAAGFLSDAVNGLLPAGAIATLIGLKVLISLEVLIPAALYVSVILTLSRLHGDLELPAMSALRLTPATTIRAVLTLSGCLALMVGSLSLFVRPWAYTRLHDLSRRAATLLDVDAMEAGSFYVSQQGSRVVFLAHRDGPGSEARDVFVRLQYGDHDEIISGKLADAIPRMIPGTGSDVHLTDADIYEIYPTKPESDQVLQAAGMIVDPNKRSDDTPGHSAVASSSPTLARSASSEDIAEFQWRLSTSLSTLLLGLVAIPLSTAMPRSGRQARFTTAFLIYFGYYLLSTSARTWVQHGTIPEFPGIWWAPCLLALLLLAFARMPALALALRRRNA